jgi:hypothetical protein
MVFHFCLADFVDADLKVGHYSRLAPGASRRKGLQKSAYFRRFSRGYTMLEVVPG